MKRRKAFTRLVLALWLILLAVLVRSTFSQAASSQQNNSLPNPITQQDPRDEVVRVDTNLVTVPVIVMDRDGRYVANLRKEDFQIFEDGIEQSVASFVPVEQPFTVALLLDMSVSMSSYVENVRDAANALLSQLSPDDQLLVIGFSDKVNVVCEATRVSDLRRGGQLRLFPGQTTRLYDAVDFALNKRLKKVPGRKAMILLTDGVDSTSQSTGRRNIHDAEEGDVLIYTVHYKRPIERKGYINSFAYARAKEEIADLYKRVGAYLQALAQKTGGRKYDALGIPDIRQAFNQIADELGRQYSLGYYPSKRLEAAQRREIKVKVSRPNVVVRARNSYVVDKDRVKAN